MVNPAGTVAEIAPSAGTINTALTNAKQAYVIFSTPPTSDFTITYSAAPDCLSQWELNVLADDVMELQQAMGPTSLTGYAGLRNLTYALFNDPADVSMSGLVQNAVFLSHLDRDIIIGNKNSTVTRNIQLGVETDTVTLDATTIAMGSSDATRSGIIQLGQHTGDFITWQGKLSGEGPLEVGGSAYVGNNPNDPNYSGTWEGAGLITGEHFSGSMLKVWGNASIMGGLQTIGSITVVHTTGQTSTILGDFTVRDELFVYGVTHLIGNTEANQTLVQKDLTVDGNVIAGDRIGLGGAGQTLVDNLDCSEIAHNYKSVTRRRLPNSLVHAPMSEVHTEPINTMSGASYNLGDQEMVGDVWLQTGTMNAAAGPSGSHPYILQLLLHEPVVSGFLNNGSTAGGISGWYCSGLMDPGSTWIKIIAGAGKGYNAPIYGHTVEGTASNGEIITKLNVFTPGGTSGNVATNDIWMMYNPGSVPYDFLSVSMGSTPTFTVSGNATDPVIVSFDDEVRILSTVSPTYALKEAFDQSTGGMGGVRGEQTGLAYIFASIHGTDPESAPTFIARPIPYGMPGETIIGEVVARESAVGNWYELETTSYRPGGVYDSAWLPVVGHTGARGRGVGFGGASSPVTDDQNRFYFNHQLGADATLWNTSMDLYIATFGVTGAHSEWGAKTRTFPYTLQGGDKRGPHGAFVDGAFTRVALDNKQIHTTVAEGRDASVFYMDGKVLGIEFHSEFFNQLSGTPGASAFDYLRLIARRDA